MTADWLNTLSIIMLLIGWWHAMRCIKHLTSMIRSLKTMFDIQSDALGKHILKNQRALKEHKENDH